MGCGAVLFCTLLHETSFRDAERSEATQAGAPHTSTALLDSPLSVAPRNIFNYLQPLMRFGTARTRSPRDTRIIFMVTGNKLTLGIQ